MAVAERSKWPTLSAVTESKVGGVRAASQATTLRIEQTLWDNGAGNERISATVTAADITEVQVILEQQDLANVDVITSAHLSEAVQYQRVLQA